MTEIKIGDVVRLKTRPDLLPFQQELRYVVTAVTADGLNVAMPGPEGHGHKFRAINPDLFEIVPLRGSIDFGADIQMDVPPTHCDNCEAKAAYVTMYDEKPRTPLCKDCAVAYRWGQSAPAVEVREIEDVWPARNMI